MGDSKNIITLARSSADVSPPYGFMLLPGTTSSGVAMKRSRRLEAAILSRTRSPISSRSNCQGDCILGVAHYQLSGYVTFPIPEKGRSHMTVRVPHR